MTSFVIEKLVSDGFVNAKSVMGLIGESDAVEIETGKSDVVWNVKKNLLSGFRRVLVVANNDKALEKVER